MKLLKLITISILLLGISSTSLASPTFQVGDSIPVVEEKLKYTTCYLQKGDNNTYKIKKDISFALDTHLSTIHNNKLDVGDIIMIKTGCE